MIVAYQEAESTQERMVRSVLGGEYVAPRDAARRARFWCAADRPETDDTFRVVAVYRTDDVSEDAQCEDCGISIRELQAFITEATR